MAKSPFYTVVLDKTNENITELITSVSYEDCLDEDDYVTFNVESASYNAIDKNVFNVGQKITYEFGYIGGKQSGKRKCIVSEIDFDYVGYNLVDITVKCKDYGFLMKKISSKKVYTNTTVRKIIEDVTAKFGILLEPFENEAEAAEFLDKNIASMPTAGKTYYQFMLELARKSGANVKSAKGLWEFYIRGEKATFKKRNIAVKPKRTFVYGDGDGIVKKVSVSYEDSDDGMSSGVSTSGVDMETGEEYTSKATSADNKESNTGGKRLDFDVNANLRNAFGGEEDAGKSLTTPSNNKGDADSKTGAGVKDSSFKVMKLNADLELDPTINAGDLTTWAGLAQKHCGNWRLKKVTHSVNNSGGETTVEGSWNGNKKSSTTTGGDNAGKTNTDKGSKDGKVTNDLRRFDQNSKRLN